MTRFLGLLVVLLLAGCQNEHMANNSEKFSTAKSKSTKYGKTHRARPHIAPTSQDGAPPGPAPSKFKKVVPVKESMSRYGNPGEYRVNGRTYEVMTTSSGYKARGMASWYGTKFHTKRTSSGENYDLYALTAAHKTLPLPTYVKVTNLSNGRHAIVKVNDRGPFHSDRIIDLSYGAAAKLGLLPKGTAPVEIEALTTHNHVAHYYLQAGAFSSRELADSLRGKLSKITPSPVFIEKYKEYYVVKVGPFANKHMSDTLKSILAHKGISGSFSMMQ
jgi:rare lipoprotein A